MQSRSVSCAEGWLVVEQRVRFPRPLPVTHLPEERSMAWLDSKGWAKNCELYELLNMLALEQTSEADK